MANTYDAIDFRYAFNGDFAVGPDGDFADTSNDQIQSLIQEIQSIVNSALGDWEEHPRFGASLDDYVGEPNTKDTASAIAERVRTSLVTNAIVAASDLTVRVVPVELSRVLIIIQVIAASTENNSIMENGLPTVSFLYDYFERGVTFVSKTNT